jgi:hypothetical protein
MATLIKLSVGDIVASSGNRVWRKLYAERVIEEPSNFILSDGSILLTADGLVFNVKEE